MVVLNNQKHELYRDRTRKRFPFCFFYRESSRTQIEHVHRFIAGRFLASVPGF